MVPVRGRQLFLISLQQSVQKKIHFGSAHAVAKSIWWKWHCTGSTPLPISTSCATYSLGSEGPVQSFLPRNKECRRTSYITKNICFCLRFFKISSKTWSHNISPYRSAWFDRCYDISHGSLVWSALKSPRMQAHTCTNSDHIYLVSVLGTGIYFSNSPVLQRWWIVL